MGLVSSPSVGEQSIIVSVSACVCLVRLFAITFSESRLLSSLYFVRVMTLTRSYSGGIGTSGLMDDVMFAH